MKKILYLLVFICYFYLNNYKAHAIIEQKIVTLAPNLTEIVYALGLGSQLVGNTVLCDYPEKAKNIYKIGNFNNPSIERIIASGSNIVIATEGNPKEKLNILKSKGIKVIQVKPQSAADLPLMIKTIADNLGVSDKGESLSKDIDNSLQKMAKIKKRNKSFLLILQFNPIYSISEETWLGSIFKLSGLKNVVGKSIIKYPIVSKEFLLKNRPDVVLVSSIEGKSRAESIEIQKQKIQELYGKDSDKIEVEIVPKDVLVRPGPRIIEGISFIESL